MTVKKVATFSYKIRKLISILRLLTPSKNHFYMRTITQGDQTLEIETTSLPAVTENAIALDYQEKVNAFRNILFSITEISYEQAIYQWLSQFKSKHTVKQYANILNKFRSWFPVALSEVTPSLFSQYSQWVKWLYLNQNTQAIKIDAVKSFFKFCVNKRYLAFNPCTGEKSIAHTHAVEERIVDQSDLARLLGIAPKISLVFNALLKFLASTGCRINEALSATFNSQTGSKNYRILSNGNVALWITGKGNKKREIAISNTLFNEIKTLAGNSNFLFNAPKKIGALSYQCAYSWFKKALKLAKITTKITFHWLRHNFAKKALQKGNDIKKVSRALGHANIATTSIYLDLLADDLVSLEF